MANSKKVSTFWCGKVTIGGAGGIRTPYLLTASLQLAVPGCAARYDVVHLFYSGLYVWRCFVLPRAAEWISKRLAELHTQKPPSWERSHHRKSLHLLLLPLLKDESLLALRTNGRLLFELQG